MLTIQLEELKSLDARSVDMWQTGECCICELNGYGGSCRWHKRWEQTKLGHKYKHKNDSNGSGQKAVGLVLLEWKFGTGIFSTYSMILACVGLESLHG